MVRHYLFAAAAAALGLSATCAYAEDTVKIGYILPMTGQQQSTGKQESAAIKLYQAQHGDTVAGKKVVVILKDDGAVPDNTKRIAQELIVNEKVNFLAGFGVTPTALAVAPLATEAKVPEVVTAAGTSIITLKSPYIVRTSFTLPQSSVPMADWAAQNGIKKVVTMVSDYAPGLDSEKSFKAEFTAKGGQILDAIRPARQSGFRAVPAKAPTPSLTPSSCSCRPDRAAPSSSSSSSAGSTRPASRSSARATSWTTISSTAWAMPLSAP